ncbi:MAG TPA: dihydropteroate synthase [Candidatus Binataceae bacterium]|nr:dihydropteroate synthase [Candidatus Binataceae bacterium]
MKLRGGVVIRFPAIMGVLNVTPDSFSDGGRYLDPQRAVEHALEIEAAGASIIDVGGESTRPVGALEVPLEEEIARVKPVLERLGQKLRIPMSIDTRRSAVARIALDAGAYIINDVTALKGDTEMASVAARSKCAVVLMHMRGGPHNHARFARYRDVISEVREYLMRRARFAESSGIAKSRIILDPGIGFAKDAAHNFAILAGLPRLCALGYPILVGASRKRFVRSIAAGGERELTIAGAAADALAVASGASIVRVHDPAAAGAAVRMAEAVRRAAMR